MALAKNDTLGRSLVKVPLYPSNTAGNANYIATATGTGATTTVTQITDTSGINPDGSAHTVTLFVPTTTTLPGWAALRGQVHGRVVGVRFRRTNSALLLPFDVIIDGEAFTVDDVNPRRNNTIVNVVDGETLYVIAEDLDDRLHTVEVVVMQDPAVVNNNSLIVYGWLAERGRGYDAPQPRPRAGYTAPAVTLTTTAATIPNVLPAAQLTFYNSDATTRTVTVYGPDGTTIYRTLSLATVTSGSVTFAAPRSLQGWKWKADAGSVVSAWTEYA